jgi:hypothetical protein
MMLGDAFEQELDHGLNASQGFQRRHAQQAVRKLAHACELGAEAP